MERGRMSTTFSQVSPERAKVWTERSPKYVQYRKVSVLYYLCRNQHLEHPHFVEIKLSSSDGLYLRDFINRLNELRGRGMASRYSWSCKRSYKTGFVWHDLSKDDLIHPASGSEYVLKGSELIEEPNSKQIIHSESMTHQKHKKSRDPASGRSHDSSSTTSSMNGKELSLSLEDAYSPRQHRGSCSVSPVYRGSKTASPAANLSLVEYKVEAAAKAANASTQTDENHAPKLSQESCAKGVSTEDTPLTHVSPSTPGNQIPQVKKRLVLSPVSGSPLSCPSESSSAGKTETLESLIKADARKINSRILEDEDINIPSNVRLKATNMIMQLLSCGTITAKDRNLGFTFIPSYKPRFSSSKFPSHLYSSSVLLGEMDYLYESPTKTELKMEDKEYFSGSLIETKMLKGIDGLAALKRSSSFDVDRTSKVSIADEEKDEVPSTGSKCIPLSIKASLGRQSKSEPARSPLSDRPRISSEYTSQNSTPCASVGNSKRILDLAVKNSPKSSRTSHGSFREDTKVTKMEEILASGARVIIQSKPTSDTK